MVLNRLISYVKNPAVAVGTFFLIVFYEAIGRVLNNLFSYQSSHGILIMAISLYMIWARRSELKRFVIKANMGSGTLLTIVGCFILVCAKVASVNLLQDVSIIISLLGLSLLVLGSSFFKVLWLPLSYLILMFPFFENIVGNFSMFLQLITASIASTLLNLIGIPVYKFGPNLELPNITLFVARSCNGVNHILALVAVAIPLSFFTHQSRRKKAIFILAALLIGLFSNGLRVALIGLWSLYHKGELLHGPFDLLYTSFVFFFGIGMIFLLGFASKRKNLLSEEQGARESSRKEAFPKAPLRSETAEKKSQKAGSFYKGSYVALTILILTLTFLHSWKPMHCPLERPLSELPTRIDGWVGRDISTVKDRQDLQRGDWFLKRLYKHPSGREVEVSIVYYSYQGKTREITDVRYRWTDWDAQIVPLHLGDEKVQVIRVRENWKGSGKEAYFWYDINGRILLDHHTVKGAIILDGLTKRCTSGAFVSIQAEFDPGQDQIKVSDESQFIRSVFPIVREYLKN